MASRHRTRAAIVVCGLLAGLLAAGCDSETPEAAATDEAVYESFFAVVAEDRDPLLFLAAGTESVWFEANPFEPEEWEEYLDDLGGIPIDLVEELYRVNRESVPIEKNPRPENVEFLPADYARPSARGGDNDHCDVPADQPNIGICSADGSSCLRAYYTVSRVAFSPDGAYALLKLSYHCAPLSGGHESFVSFKRDGGDWQPIGGHLLWMS